MSNIIYSHYLVCLLFLIGKMFICDISRRFNLRISILLTLLFFLFLHHDEEMHDIFLFLYSFA